MSKWVGVGISNTIPKKLAMSYCSWSSPPPFIALPRPQLNSERVQDTFDLELRSRILHWAWLICIIYCHIWDTQCRSGCRMVLPSFQAVSYDWCAILSANFYTFFQSSCARHEIGPGYWSDNVTICQLVITTSFHSSLLSLITCHITIATSESTFNLTTVILFTRPQSLTLSPSIILSSLSQHSLLLCCQVMGLQGPYVQELFSDTLQFPKLNGTNYYVWSDNMKAALQAHLL